MRAKTGKKGGEGLDRDCGNNKGNPEAERIHRQQTDTLENCRLRRRQSEHRGKDWSDARRPAECKGKTH